ncbi:MAG: HAD family hydrolase [Candidatus Eremiobacteraeota bacterium]|nr:HAD family hydrolase [Candidatus Eremiobacteraeota bacterium]
MTLKGVLFDRDGTIVHDVPYNGDPALVDPVPRAKELLDELRARGIKVGVLSNQSGIGRGMITHEQMEAVNRRVDELLGPFDGWYVCPHAPEEDCECRKPKPKLVLDAAQQWRVHPSEIAVIGDKTSDVDVAKNAGAVGVLVGRGVSLNDAVGSLLRE